MVIDKALIRKELADKHNIIIADNDPIMSFLIFNDTVLDIYVQEINKKLKMVEGAMEDIADKYSNESKQLAEKIIADALKASQASIQAESEKFIREMNKLPLAFNNTKATQAEENKYLIPMGVVLAFNVLLSFGTFALMLIFLN